MRDCMWFGTEQRSLWIPTPVSGAEMSPQGWSAGGTLLSGGGYQANSWGSHKVYTFEWSNASAIEMAQLMKSYSDGTYGRRLIYFHDPLTYDKNILPARIADPSMAVGDESATMVYGVNPTPVVTSGWEGNQLPVTSAFYNLAGVPAGFRGEDEAVYISIPEGYTLYLSAFHSYTGTGGIFYSPQNIAGQIGSPVRLNALANDSNNFARNTVTGVPGVWLWLGRTSTAASTVTATAISARLTPTTGTHVRPNKGPWIGGMGHSGVRFATRPTWKAHSGVNGGQVGFAASFREVGSWSYA